ncbi:glycoside hydrolase family 2 TIM barrel-domain containing protein [Rhodocytophaga aerolata]|uniref:Glycoside hydrolase family 2 TIM barrel-domain containing protein n=1 Tax=Rhodocytophaga aerolata TaxID=455078 RepID=A0ABT8RES6_9BACT|nr:sugar-binding domain-containing protein [Rhodocytophaga aerolata]MDO1450484.1 glycoside hydrolase family 2 TIM barrel-domain containing protein [Rhodocytophaga aerolata]
MKKIISYFPPSWILRSNLILCSILISCQVAFGQAVAWKPVEGHIMTKWAKEVTPTNVLPDYPRPQMARKEWKNLNGLWEYAIAPKDNTTPQSYNGQILVPFPVESAMSGVKKLVGKENKLWYRHTFEVPATWANQRLLLHFGAVDWQSTVSINGKQVGTHEGGYDPFYFDITDALKKEGKQEVIVSVWDPTSEGTQPRGKQVVKPEGIWYTPVTGIWQTVWLEPVPVSSIKTFKTTPDIDKKTLTVAVEGQGTQQTDMIKVIAMDGNKEVASATNPIGQPVAVTIPTPKLWSPDSPFLYDVKIQLLRNGKAIDEVSSYAGMRKISLAKDKQGIPRLMLNNKFVFQYGTLDQGWWPDGLYTAPTDEALKFDIEKTKEMGFNMIRKHVKVEPARWYMHCDKVGILVWQDMPSGDKSAEWKAPSGIDGQEMTRTAESEAHYKREWKAIIDAFYNYPSIVMWVPFNEGWGQFKTEEIINWTTKYDPSRLINGPSGGNHFPVAHTIDHHQYPGPGMPPTQQERAMVLGEFGGLGLPVTGHLWQEKDNWGYRKYQTSDTLTMKYADLINQIPDMIIKGLSAAIYTQTTDVEGEVNGLMTYDRAMIKMDADRVRQINSVLTKPTVSPSKKVNAASGQ